MKYTLPLASILSNEELQDFLGEMDQAACEWLGLHEEMMEASHISVTFEVPD